MVNTYREVCARGVNWYRKNGRFPERIVKDSCGVEYVVGDWSWHRIHPSIDWSEYVDARMKEEAGA